MCVRVHFLKSNLVRKQTLSSRKNADDAVRNEQEKNTSLPPFFSFVFHFTAPSHLIVHSHYQN